MECLHEIGETQCQLDIGNCVDMTVFNLGVIVVTTVI